MGLVKTVGLVIVAGAAGSMIAAVATPKLTALNPTLAKNAGAVNTGVTAGSAALVFIVLNSVL